MDRLCKKCGETKPLTLEHWYQRTKNGSTYFESPCRTCRLAKQKHYMETKEGYAEDHKRRNQKYMETEKGQERAREKAKRYYDKFAEELRPMAAKRSIARHYALYGVDEEYTRKHNLRAEKYRIENPEWAAEQTRKWRENNPELAKEVSRRSQRRQKELYPERIKALKAVYRHGVRDNRPSWLSVEHKAEIAAIYAEARRLTAETGEIYHVDHIVPMNGKTISGLHVPWNMQVIPASENLAKGNRFED